MIPVVGIDVGRHRVKAVSGTKQVDFRSKVGEWRQMRLVEGGDYEVEINGKKWFVADLADESYFPREMSTESKVHEETQILFLTALALIIEPDNHVAITTGVPVIQHTLDSKAALSGLLRGQYEVKINGTSGKYNVDTLGIVPESGGAYWDLLLDSLGRPRNGWLAEQTVRVIDIGSRTINYCTIDAGRKYRDRDSGTLNYGGFELDNAGSRHEQAHEAFARRIVADLSRRWLNYNPSQEAVILVGGGALLLGPWLRRHFPIVHIPEDPVFANARGYYKMGVARWNKS